MNVLNLLYCFDENYNIQTTVSIDSICRCANDVDINVYIIHRKPSSFEKYIPILQKHSHLKKIELYEFDKNIKNYPNLSNKHVSEATYYRLFISDFLPNDLSEVIYLDSDVFCINYPIENIKNTISNMKNLEMPISVSTEIQKESEDHDLFKNLELKKDNYFNAGVMFIDYKKWQQVTSVNEFILLINKYKDKIIFWDQDILNKKFEDNYFELDDSLNFRKITNHNVNEVRESINFLHYVGNYKPWTIEGGCEEKSKIYFELFKKVFNKKYHFKIKDSRLRSILVLFKNIFSMRVIQTNYPLSYIFYSLKTIFSIKR